MVIMSTLITLHGARAPQEENVKKILLGIFVVAMIIGLTACSQDLSSRMGTNMQKMGNNIYGIKANMADVNKASGAVSNSVDSEGNVNINKAADIMKMLDGIKQSKQKTEALRESLQESAGTTDAQLAASVTETKAALEAKIATLEDGNQKTVANVIQSALESVESSVSPDPTKAEVATVAILNEMAKVITNLDDDSIENIADQGQEALDALLIVSGLGSMDLLDKLTLQNILGSVGSKAAGDDDEQFFQHMVTNLVKFVCTDGKFSQLRYNSFIFQAKILRSAYEMISLKYIRNATSVNDYDAILKTSFSHGLDVEDLVKYIISWNFIEIDNIIGNDIIGETLGAMISPTNYDKLTNLADLSKDFDDDAMQEALKKFSDAALLAFGLNLDALKNFSFPSTRQYSDDELLEDILRDELNKIYKAKDIEEKQKLDPEFPRSDEERDEYLEDDDVSLQIITAVTDAMSQEKQGEYAIPFNPTYDTESRTEEEIAAIRAERETLIRGYLKAEPFNYTDESLQEAMDEALEAARENDMMFMALAITFQVSEILDPEKGKDKIADLGDAVKALPGDFMRFVGTAVVILTDAEWHETLLSLAKVPASEEHKVSYLLKASSGSLFGFGEEVEE